MKYTPEFKVAVAKEAIETDQSSRQLAKKYNIGASSTVLTWTNLYKKYGESYFYKNEKKKEDFSEAKNVLPENQVEEVVEIVHDEKEMDEEKDEEISAVETDIIETKPPTLGSVLKKSIKVGKIVIRNRIKKTNTIENRRKNKEEN